ncbi:hypothetical protein [Shewanella maritima]|nr:hypothetical protein [Shewanella maritima]
MMRVHNLNSTKWLLPMSDLLMKVRRFYQQEQYFYRHLGISTWPINKR